MNYLNRFLSPVFHKSKKGVALFDDLSGEGVYSFSPFRAKPHFG
jgi:hypothetical protein